jgi:hypothetical protein
LPARPGEKHHCKCCRDAKAQYQSELVDGFHAT